MYIIGIVIFLFGLCLTMFFKHIPFEMLLNTAGITLLLFSIMGVIVASSSYRLLVSGLNSIFSKKYVIEDDTRNKAAELFRLLTKTAIFSSLLNVLFGIIAALVNYENISYFVHALSAGLVSSMFGLIISIAMFEPAAYILKHRNGTSSIIKSYPKHISDKLIELCNQNGISEEDILNATDIILRKNEQ